MAATGFLSLKVTGAKEVERALHHLPSDADRALKKERRRLAKNLTAKLRRAVISKTKISRETSPEPGRRGGRASHRPMGIRVLPTIHQRGTAVIAGPHPMLFGTEYGMSRKSGWYAYPQFVSFPNLQYFRHQNDGYWWRPTILHSKPEADAAVRRAADEALSHWDA